MGMDRVDAMRVFVRIVDLSSLTKAGAGFGIKTATVSRLIKSLETRTNVRLLNRNTRHVSPTEEGRTFYDACVRVLAQIDEMEHEAANTLRIPEGRIVIGLPSAVAKNLLIPALPSLMKLYPKLRVAMEISDRQIDLALNGADCAIRIGPVQEGDVVAKQLGKVSRIICASPDYLSGYGEPTSVEDLKDHVAVGSVWDDESGSRPWMFGVDGGVASVTVKSRIVVNDADCSIQCAVGGMGIVSGDQFTLRPFIEKGLLKELLPNYRPEPRPFSVIYYPNRNMPYKLRVFIEWLKTVCENSIQEKTGAECNMNEWEQRAIRPEDKRLRRFHERDVVEAD